MRKITLPPEVYRLTLWFVRTYPRTKAKYNELLGLSAVSMDGQPRSSMPGNPTARDAEKRLRYRSDIDAVELSLLLVPEEYREGIMSNIIYRKRYPDYAHLNTWKKWKARFIFNVAILKGWWDEDGN